MSGFDRVVFKGQLPLGWPEAMKQLLARHNVLIKDFKYFVKEQAEVLKEHAQAVAAEAGRPYRRLNGRQDEEKIAEGLVPDAEARQRAVAVRGGLAQSQQSVPGPLDCSARSGAGAKAGESWAWYWSCTMRNTSKSLNSSGKTTPRSKRWRHRSLAVSH